MNESYKNNSERTKFRQKIILRWLNLSFPNDIFKFYEIIKYSKMFRTIYSKKNFLAEWIFKKYFRDDWILKIIQNKSTKKNHKESQNPFSTFPIQKNSTSIISLSSQSSQPEAKPLTSSNKRLYDDYENIKMKVFAIKKKSLEYRFINKRKFQLIS